MRSQSRLAKWVKDKKQNLFPPDQEALAHLFYKTNLGRALRADASLPLPTIDNLLHLITSAPSGVAHGRARDLCGIYLAHHGSHMEEKHFVVRAVEIKQITQGYLTVEDWLTDNETRAKTNGGAHRAKGIAALVLWTYLLKRVAMCAFTSSNRISKSLFAVVIVPQLFLLS